MVNTTDPPERSLEARSKALFDTSVAELDAATRSRLRQARHAAVEQAGGRARFTWWVPTLTGAVVAGLLILALPMLGPKLADVPLNDNLAARAEDLSLLMNDEDLDLLEDMEFYAWLDETPEAFEAPAESDRGAS